MDKGTNERMRADYLHVCEGKALHWRVFFAVVWVLGYVSSDVHPGDWTSSLFSFLRVLLKCNCLMYRSSSVFFVDVVSCSSHFLQPLLFHALYITLQGGEWQLCSGRNNGHCNSLGSCFSRLMDPTIYVLQ